jgi:hypothetical protein
MHFSPTWDGGASLGTMDLYWESLYLNNNSLIMSGEGMTGAVHIGFDNEHNLRISAPKTGNEVTLSGTPVTGYTSNTLADLRLSGDSATEATTLKATSEGEVSISTESEAGGQTTLSNKRIQSPSGLFVSGLRVSGSDSYFDIHHNTSGIGYMTFLGAQADINVASGGIAVGKTDLSPERIKSDSGIFVSGLTAKSSTLGTYFDLHADGINDVADMTYCGQFNQCVEDLGQYKSTGWAPDPYAIGEGGSSFKINMAGPPLKKFNLASHAHGLSLTNIKAGRSITVQVTCVDDFALGEGYFRFLSGNSMNFLGIEPHTLKIGKMGMLTITAYGTGESSCVCHWAETDYMMDIDPSG